LRQFWQRFGENGSTTPQNGHADTTLSMNLPQYGHGCLKVGIVRSYQPEVPEGFDLSSEPASGLEPLASGGASGVAAASAASAASMASPPSPPTASSPPSPASEICDS
jgi:hypothetical protein